MKSYRDLIVSQKAVEMVTLTYKLLKLFPDEEKFGLTLQIKRSAISIPSNIAEGYGRNYTKDYARFLQIASGSLFEFQTQFQIAVNLGFLDNKKLEEINGLSVEIEKILNTLIKKLNA